MNKKWSRIITAIAISALLMTQGLVRFTYADEATTTTPVFQSSQYPLTPTLKAEVKSVLSEKKPDGLQIAAVVRLENTGSRVTRVPEYELRAKTADGMVYTLQPSATNVKSVQPKEKGELSYLVVVDRDDAISLDEIQWVKVNKFVYPMEESTVLSVSVAGITWQGKDSDVDKPTFIKKWGEPFRIPVLSKNLEYTPLFTTNQSTDVGPVVLVAMLAENMGEMTETIPAFTLEGHSDVKSYLGNMVQTNVELKKGEKKVIHFLIPMDTGETLKNVNVVSQESYVAPENQTIKYMVGRLSILMPEQNTAIWNHVPEYKMGEAMVFDPYSKLMDPNLKVSLVELNMNGSDSEGFKTIMAKLLVRNNTDRPMVLPALGMELTNAEGYTYVGTCQDGAPHELSPKLGYIVNYFFTVPYSEKGDKLLLKMLDTQLVKTAVQTSNTYGVPISSYKVAVQPLALAMEELSFYPYSIKMRSWVVAFNYSEISSYTYKLKLDMEINKAEDIVVNENSTYMKIELVDTLGRMIGSESFHFTGQNALVSGDQTLIFKDISTESYSSNLTIKIYEAVKTPTGEAKRLVKELK